MSTAFTDPYTWPSHPLPLVSAQEILTAYNERIEVSLGGDPVPDITDGTDAQDSTLWSGMMSSCLANCVYFVDYVNGPLLPDNSGFLFFTPDTFKMAAFGNTNGFRRCLAKEADGVTPIFSEYGPIQPGDYHGPWNFEDLQKALTALKWTTRVGDGVGGKLLIPSTATQRWEFGYAGTEIAPDDLFSAPKLSLFNSHMSAYGSPSWDSDAGGFPIYSIDLVYYGHWRVYPPSGGITICDNFNLQFFINRSRNRGKAHIAGLPAIPRSADIYFKLTANGTFNDLDGIGLSEGQLNFIETIGETSDAEEQQSNYFLEVTDDPAELAGISVDMNEIVNPDPELGGTLHDVGLPYSGCVISNSNWLLKWNFTNSN